MYQRSAQNYLKSFGIIWLLTSIILYRFWVQTEKISRWFKNVCHLPTDDKNANFKSGKYLKKISDIFVQILKSFNGIIILLNK